MSESEITGPQLQDANLKDMPQDNLEKLATLVGLDLAAAEDLHKQEQITREELRWVQSDAERVRNELIRRTEGLGQEASS